MADKKITDLQLRGSIVDTVNIPVDDGIQSYRVTAPMIFDYVRGKFSTVRTVTAATTLTAADVLVLLNPASSFTQPLPAVASIATGTMLELKNIHASNTVTLDANSSELIDTGETLILEPGDAIRLFNVGTAWLVLESYLTVRRAKIEATERLPIGVVMPYAGSSAPTGFLFCDGSAISRSTYAALFAVVSTTYGTGNGTTTFNIPDTRGIFIRGLGSQTFNSETYTGTSLGFKQIDGTAVNGLLSSHSHGFPGNSIYQNSTSGSSTNGPYVAGYGPLRYGASGSAGSDYTALTATSAASAITSGDTDTRPANISLNHIIKY